MTKLDDEAQKNTDVSVSIHRGVARIPRIMIEPRPLPADIPIFSLVSGPVYLDLEPHPPITKFNNCHDINSRISKCIIASLTI